MDISRPGLAREIIRLLIAVIRLIIAILTFVGGATNYPSRCAAPTSTSSLCPTAIKYTSLRRQGGKRARWYMRMCGVAGDHPTTFIIFAAAAMSPH